MTVSKVDQGMCHIQYGTAPHLEDDAELALANLLAQADVGGVNLQQPGLSSEEYLQMPRCCPRPAFR